MDTRRSCLMCLALTIGSAFGADPPTSRPSRMWRELIKVSITDPKTVMPLWINQELAYHAAAACVDQFSDDGGTAWTDAGVDRRSPPPVIVWSATVGSFANYTGETTTYQAPDGSLVNDTVNDAVAASATTNGNDIYGVPATVQPEPMSPPDTAASKPAAASQPQQSNFDAEIKAAYATTDRDERIQHFQRAVALRPGDPLNIQIKFRIANMLCFNADLAHHQSVHPEAALKVFEGILSRYDHTDYYESNPPGAWDEPQLMLPRSAVLAASILLLQPDNARKAGEYAERAMKDIQWSFDHRRNEWAAAPKPVQEDPRFEGLGDGFAGRVRSWENRKQLAASGSVKGLLGSDAISLAATAVQIYATSVASQHPEQVPAAMRHLIEEFPNTPMADAAQKEMQKR